MSYNFQPLTHNGQPLFPTAINHFGTIIGSTLNKSAFILTPTSYQEVPVPVGAQFLTFNSINSAGQIAAIITTSTTTYSCIYQNGAFGPPDPSGDIYFALDDENHKVGARINAAGTDLKGLLDTIVVDIPGANNIILRDVTNTYQNKILAVGTYQDSGSSITRSFIRDSTQSTLIPIAAPAGSFELGASGINDFGTVVGYYRIGTVNNTHGFVRTADGTFTDLFYPNRTRTFANGISYNGTIVGDADDLGENHVGFIATRNDAYGMGILISTLQFASGMDNFEGVSDPGYQDVDGDGHITLIDAELMLRKIAGLSPNP